MAVDGDMVVVAAEQDAVGEAGAAAVGFVADVVDFADRGRLAAARPAAVPVAVPDQVPGDCSDGWSRQLLRPRGPDQSPARPWKQC